MDDPVTTPGRRPSVADIPFTRDGVPVPVPAITPLEARAEALRLAIAAAGRRPGRAGSSSPTHDRPAPTVVVPARHRAAFLTALADVPDHFSLLDPGDRGWPVRRLPARDLVAVLTNAAPNRIVLEPWPRSEGRRSYLGEDAGVEIEFWDRLPDGTLVAPRPNRWTQSVPARDADGRRPPSPASTCRPWT